jgi:hypothetical protein
MPRNQAAAVETPDEPQATSKVRGRTQPTRSHRKTVDTREQRVGQDKPRAMKSTGPARQSLEPAHVEAVDEMPTKDHLDALRFMEEELVVMVHDSTNPVDEPFPEVWNDGIVQRFQRGKEQTVKRKYIEVLARAKKTVFSQENYKDAQGIDSIRQVPHTALRYPFSVIQDPSGDKGRAWLKKVLAEA